MMGGLPTLSGPVKVTVTIALPGVAVPMVGAPGRLGATAGATGVTLLDAADAGPVPALLVAVTLQLMGVLASPVTVNGETVPLAVWEPQVAV